MRKSRPNPYPDAVLARNYIPRNKASAAVISLIAVRGTVPILFPIRSLGMVNTLSIMTSDGASNPFSALGSSVYRSSGLFLFSTLVSNKTTSDPFPSNRSD